LSASNILRSTDTSGGRTPEEVSLVPAAEPAASADTAPGPPTDQLKEAKIAPTSSAVRKNGRRRRPLSLRMPRLPKAGARILQTLGDVNPLSAQKRRRT
jgi:hypothetical protein